MSTTRNTQSTTPINDKVQQLIDYITGEIEHQPTEGGRKYQYQLPQPRRTDFLFKSVISNNYWLLF